MNKIIVLVLLSFGGANAQTISLNDRLSNLCRFWGYVKYFHNKPSNCQLNWDSVLLANLNAVRNASTLTSYNSVLQDMLNAAGPMLTPTTPAFVIPAGYNTNLNLNWFTDPVFTPTLSAQLDTIRNRFRPHAICNVIDNSTYTNTSYGFMGFADDYPSNFSNPNYPQPNERLLVAFRYWNYMNYFFNSLGLTDVNWFTTLKKIIPQLDSAATAESYQKSMIELAVGIDDTHAAYANSTLLANNLGYSFPFYCRYIQGRVVVTRTLTGMNNTIHIGDVVKSIDGIPVDTVMLRKARYVPHSNVSSLKRVLLDPGKKYIFSGAQGSTVSVGFQLQGGGTTTLVLSRNVANADWITALTYTGSPYRKLDTLGCSIGYVHMGKLVNADISAMYSDLKTCSAIIFDLRNYPNQTGWTFANLLSPLNFTYALLYKPSTIYPGIMQTVYYGTGQASSDPYLGNIYVLVNEITQSQAEYTTMMFKACSNKTRIVGSQTAGADGDVSYIHLPGQFTMYFSTLGVFYPSLVGAQRVGVAIDYSVTPTINGVIAGKDELLGYVINTLVGCTDVGLTSNTPLGTLKIFPNPAKETVEIELPAQTVNSTIEIRNLFGQVVMTKENSSRNNRIQVSGLPEGVYIVEVSGPDFSYSQKLILSK